MTTMLQVRDLALRRGDRTILSDTSFSLAGGGVAALMGPSGSGKTTVLRAIAGLERFEAGTIVLNGLTLKAGQRHPGEVVKKLRRQVGVVFQFHHLFEHLTALRNVTLAPMHVLGVPARFAERRARELLEVLGVEHRASALPRELSGGEAQRVAIARALAVDPPLLMMDEPTASLDPSRRQELGELLSRLADQNRTILLTTHDEEFAARWATTILRVNNGVVV
ncbi:MAG TPA: ATP-binding cassette domain-containing protein [Vicinamibacterales bacterium]|nr:ATP-binding cassette domain-containing protein [Vicinamibacterales bacterium]